jgi:hypothetical protein
MFDRPTIKELLEALKPLANIPRPYGDNEGDPINSDTVFPFLSPEHQEKVLLAEEKAYEYSRTFNGQVDRRALTTMNKNGIPANLGPSQYHQDRLVGSVTVGDWEIDISDPHNEADDDN